MSTAKNVTFIPATLDIHTRAPKNAPVKRKVAGYARVSTGSEEQATSYEAQVDYYTSYIKGRDDWEFVGVYTDDGISALSTKKRDGFNQMVQDALDGKIDLIVTKSVSRFARNTVDSLTTIRKLKEHGTECYFEKEGIYSFDSKGELLLTIMSSLAQEESRSISENVTWGQRKRFADGKVSMPYKHFLGYRKGADGLPEIVPEEAEIVRQIYRLFIQGKTPGGIARLLTEEGIPTPGGKTRWQSSVITSILTNEKYKGSALLQKAFTVDYLSKKMKKNEGEVPQYYVEESHPGIIPPEEWNRVQAEIARRQALANCTSGGSVFSSRIFCGDCGCAYGPKVWHSNDKYRRTVWQCNGKFKGEHRCRTPHLYEKDIQTLFLTAYGEILRDRSSVAEDCRYVQRELCDTADLESRMDFLADEMAVAEELIRRCIEDNAAKAQDQAEYYEKYDKYTRRFDALKEEYDTLEKECRERREKFDVIGAFIDALETAADIPIEFDEDTFAAVVEKLTVYADERVEFTFKGGVTVTRQL
ncbi:MAG: recombinase family protein [Oscillospiraceae bacterium]|nr:recombinase family protein [Oscillospiraceae bacterium]